MFQDALDYMSHHADDVANHGGNAYAENVILSGMLQETGDGGAVGDAYLAYLKKSVPKIKDRAGAYVFTHAVFFASDFGRIPLEVDKTSYAALIEKNVEVFTDDADVLGELLISALCIKHWSNNLDKKYELFKSAWQDAHEEDFNQSYHLILVGGILDALKG